MCADTNQTANVTNFFFFLTHMLRARKFLLSSLKLPTKKSFFFFKLYIWITLYNQVVLLSPFTQTNLISTEVK